MSVGIVLVHGYTGSPENLKPLAQQLSAGYGNNSVRCVILPGHDCKHTPPFDEQAFINSIGTAVASCQKENRRIILMGHSTGGNLAISFILKNSF
ncbi:MAG: alpha/beta hydrolase, partial [Nitrospirae bacterium]|nr:alpha/beta hydrolase [Nitrospirota bacterium]